MLTRKHYEVLARSLRASYESDDEYGHELEQTVNLLCRLLSKDNEAFDSQRFKSVIYDKPKSAV